MISFRNLTVVLFVLFQLVGNAQICDDGELNGNEFRIDCGGEMCPECIPLWHRVECEDGLGTGVYYIEVALPSYLWNEEEVLKDYYFELGGDISVECFTLNECQGFRNYQEGNEAQIEIYKKTIPDQNVLGYGIVKAKKYCVISTDIAHCPDSLENNISATYEKILLEDSASYMLKISIKDGISPFSILDNDTDSLYYVINHQGYEPYYLGAIPNGVDLDLSVIDINGCSAPILNIADTLFIEDTISVVDTIMSLYNLPTGFDCVESNFTVYPTFHNEKLNAQFCLEYFSTVTINIFDINGQYVDTVMDGEPLNEGTHNVPIYLKSISTGVYFYTLEIEGVDDFDIVKTVKVN